MNRLDIMMRTRSLVRDLANSFFREVDVTNYINEGIDRLAQVIPEFRDMAYLTQSTQEITHLPREWQHILSLYCASRLCTQDERFYQAGTFMNEFETKLDTLKALIDGGDVDIIDPTTGEAVIVDLEPSTVLNTYFLNKKGYVPNQKNEWGE